MSRESDRSILPYTCLRSERKPIFHRIGLNTIRRTSLYPTDHPFVVKTQTKIIGEVTFDEVKREKRALDDTAKFLPIQETLFVYGVDNGKKSMIRIQPALDKTVAQMSEGELANKKTRHALSRLIDQTEEMVESAGWMPEVCGFAPTLKSLLFWPDLRSSTNLMTDENGEVYLVDANRSFFTKRTSNWLGRLVIRYALSRLRKFKEQLTDEDNRRFPKWAEAVAAKKYPYRVTGIDNLPDQPPYIVVFNHDIAVGKYTNASYDGWLVSGVLRQLRHISPILVAKTHVKFKQQTCERLFGRFARPVFKKIMQNIIWHIDIDNGLRDAAAQRALVNHLKNGGVVDIASARGPDRRQVKSGSIVLSFLAKQGERGIPIVPLRFSLQERKGMLITIHPAIDCHFSTESQILPAELEAIRNRLYEKLFGGNL